MLGVYEGEVSGPIMLRRVLSICAQAAAVIGSVPLETVLLRGLW